MSLTRFLILMGCALPMLGACARSPEASADPSALAGALRSQPIVLLGEVHDNAEQHALRAQALRALLDGGARPALVMEQFDRDRQASLDRVLAGPHPTVDDVIAAGAPDASALQGWNWSLYRPYLRLALDYRLAVVAGNVSREDTRRIVKAGLAAYGFEPAVPADLLQAQAEALVQGHCGMLELPQARVLVLAQVARDQFMARALQAHAEHGAVLLAGNGHVRRDIGVPRWMAPEARAHSVSIGVLERDGADDAAFDRVFRTAAQPRNDPCAGLRDMNPAASAPAAMGS